MSDSECKPGAKRKRDSAQPQERPQPNRMLRTARLLLITLLPTAAMAQVPPPGNPCDPVRIPNPIITFVEDKDFTDADYAQVQKDAGIEILGLSQSEGNRASLAIAPGRFVRSMTIIGNVRSDVT